MTPVGLKLLTAQYRHELRPETVRIENRNAPRWLLASAQRLATLIQFTFQARSLAAAVPDQVPHYGCSIASTLCRPVHQLTLFQASSLFRASLLIAAAPCQFTFQASLPITAAPGQLNFPG